MKPLLDRWTRAARLLITWPKPPDFTEQDSMDQMFVAVAGLVALGLIIRFL